MREKWLRADYREGTIHRTITHCHNVWQPNVREIARQAMLELQGAPEDMLLLCPKH